MRKKTNPFVKFFRFLLNMGPTQAELDTMRAKLTIDLMTMKSFYSEKKLKIDGKINQILLDIQKLKSSSRFKKLGQEGSSFDVQKFKSSSEFMKLEKDYKTQSLLSKYYAKLLSERIEGPLNALELGSTFKDLSAMNRRISKFKKHIGMANDEFNELELELELTSNKALQPGKGEDKRIDAETSLVDSLKNIVEPTGNSDIDDRLNRILDNNFSVNDLQGDE